MEYEVVSFYRFTELNKDQMNQIVENFEDFHNSIGLRGLIILAEEGLNGTVACPQGKLNNFTEYLESEITGGDWKYKFSASTKPPFKRLSIKIRDEIVTSGFPHLAPDCKHPSHLSPEEWHQALSEEKDYLLIDVRNDYEVSLGTFENAIDPKTKDFKEFPEFVKNNNLPKDKRIYMCCTGGIRCEKAYLEMKELGYENIYQLDGGILSYLEKYPDGYFKGECFVFDDRVALDKDLNPSSNYALCPHCGDPAKDVIPCKVCDTAMKICKNCLSISKRNTCSKNCAYHYDRIQKLKNDTKNRPAKIRVS